jgi:hypothetical protein
MYRLLLILCLCTSICNAQHIKIGASQLINDTVKVAGVLATDTDCAAVVILSKIAEPTNPVDEPAVSLITNSFFEHPIAVSYDGEYMNVAAADNSFYAYRWDAVDARYELIASYPAGFVLYGGDIAMSPDGQFCMVGKFAQNHIVYKRNTGTHAWEALATQPWPYQGANPVFSEDGARLVYDQGGSGSPRAFNWNGSEYVAANAPDPQFPDDSTCMAMSYDGSTLIAGFNISHGATTLRSYKWDAVDGRYEITATPDVLGSTTYSISLTSDGTRALVYDSGNKKSNIYDWDAVDNRFEFVETLADLEYPTMSADGNMISGYSAFRSAFTVHAVFYKRIGGTYVMMPKTHLTRVSSYQQVGNVIAYQISGDGSFVSNGYETYTIYDDLVNTITPVTSPYDYTGTESAIGFLPGRGKTGDTKTITAIWAAPYLQ